MAEKRFVFDLGFWMEWLVERRPKRANFRNFILGVVRLKLSESKLRMVSKVSVSRVVTVLYTKNVLKSRDRRHFKNLKFTLKVCQLY